MGGCKKYIEELCANSENKQFEDAKREWELIGVDDKKLHENCGRLTSCICGQQLMTLYYIRNIKNGIILINGSCCVHKIMTDTNLLVQVKHYEKTCNQMKKLEEMQYTNFHNICDLHYKTVERLYNDSVKQLEKTRKKGMAEILLDHEKACESLLTEYMHQTYILYDISESMINKEMEEVKAICDFGKHKGEPYLKIPRNYVFWSFNDSIKKGLQPKRQIRIMFNLLIFNKRWETSLSRCNIIITDLDKCTIQLSTSMIGEFLMRKKVAFNRTRYHGENTKTISF